MYSRDGKGGAIYTTREEKERDREIDRGDKERSNVALGDVEIGRTARRDRFGTCSNHSLWGDERTYDWSSSFDERTNIIFLVVLFYLRKIIGALRGVL